MSYALALGESLARFAPAVGFHILIVDRESGPRKAETRFSKVTIHYAPALCKEGVGKRLQEKYGRQDMDCFRWSMKSVFLKALLEEADQAFFVDPDTCFFGPFGFLNDELAGNSVLLTPHWRSSRPAADERNFGLLRLDGLFNAGFVGATRAGIPALEWWAEACEYRCARDRSRGFWNDQGYLDLLPVYFEGVRILRHKGCNVADWNRVECPRSAGPDGSVQIAGEWPLVFVHFTRSTVRGIREGRDPVLAPPLAAYEEALARYSDRVPSPVQNGSGTGSRGGGLAGSLLRLFGR
jgi:hypothetical protein